MKKNDGQRPPVFIAPSGLKWYHRLDEKLHFNQFWGGAKVNSLFSKIPENFFSLLSRKYKSVYALALLTLYDALKIYKTKIRKVDYTSLLRSKSEDMMTLFDLALDRQDDKDADERIEELPIDESGIAVKISYIVRKLELTGWIEVEKDLRTNTEYIYLPAYAIRMLELINSLTADTSFYLPLVHQTYSELKLEDEKEDDYMFRTINNAHKNAEELELSVTLLHHSICVFGHKLANVYSPNEVLHQHFDDYRVEISDKIYHPMKTYDSLGLYAMPTIAILKRWQRDDRIVLKMVTQARNEPAYAAKSQSEIVSAVVKIIQDTIDIFAKLSKAFDDIDRANASYTEAVQKKVNYLSSSDKTIQGKIKAILVEASKRIKETDEDYDDIEFIKLMTETITCYHQVYLDQDSLTLPIKRTARDEEYELQGLEDPFDPDSEPFDSVFTDEISRFSADAVDDFMAQAFQDRSQICTEDINFSDMDSFILFILATVRAELQLAFYRMEKLADQEILTQGFLLPHYRFTRRKENNK